MNKLVFYFTNLKTKYNNLVNYCWNNAVDYYHFGYNEFKIYLFFYSLLKFNIKEYKNGTDEFYEVFSDSVDKFLNNDFVVFHPCQSKIIKELLIYFNGIKYSILFS